MEKQVFLWNNLGNLAFGRPNLGSKTDVMTYRLMQYTLRSVLEQRFGYEVCRELLKESGKLAGAAYCSEFLDITLEPYAFIAQLSQQLADNGIGILRTEKSNLNKLEFIFTVSEDLDCYGLPITGETVCDYDEGFIQGIMEAYLSKKFIVSEIDCWATGDRTCRFDVKPEE